MITKLTKAQEKKIAVYLKKGEDIGYRTKTIDRVKAKKAVDFLYKDIMKIDKPKYVIFLDSPMAVQLAYNLIKNTKFYDKITDSQLRSQLNSQLASQLRSQLDSQLYSQLYSQLESQLNLQYLYPTITNLGWTGYYTFYNYILNELLPEKKKDFKLFTTFLKHYSEIHYCLFFKDIAFVSDFPKKIRLNDRKQLHSYNEAALEYRDGYSLFQSNGITMDEKYIKTPANQITKEMFLSETNADKRREISKKLGIERTIEMLGAEVVDTYKSSVGGVYELLMVDFDNRGNKRPYLKMKNPSLNDTHHIEGIHPSCKTVKDALSYRNGLLIFAEPESLS